MVRVRVPRDIAVSVRALVEDARRTAGMGVRRVTVGAPIRRIPYFGVSVPAGFPSPAEQYLEAELDLNEYLVPQGHAASTYLLRAQGRSMMGAGIHDGDLLVVDRAAEPVVGKVVVAVVNGEMTVKRLRMRKGHPVLVPENPEFQERIIAEGEDLSVWGVVVHVIHEP